LTYLYTMSLVRTEVRPNEGLHLTPRFARRR
jgi:hypothetical protein